MLMQSNCTILDTQLFDALLQYIQTDERGAREGKESDTERETENLLQSSVFSRWL